MSVPQRTTYTRRQILAAMASASAALWAGACVPARVNFLAYPAVYDRDEALVAATLAAFVRTVAPGVPATDAELTRVFDDPFFPFEKFRGLLVADLCKRSTRRAGCPFPQLAAADRAAVVVDGLRGDPVSRQLYEAAIFLTQLAAFGGIYAPDAAAPAMHFPGGGQAGSPSSWSYPEPQRYLARQLTEAGNAQ